MNKEEYTINGTKYVRVSKKDAKICFNMGADIHCAMNNTRMDYLGAWNLSGCLFRDTGYGVTFEEWCEKALGTMKYYRLGTYLKFFVEIERA